MYIQLDKCFGTSFYIIYIFEVFLILPEITPPHLPHIHHMRSFTRTIYILRSCIWTLIISLSFVVIRPFDFHWYSFDIVLFFSTYYTFRLQFYYNIILLDNIIYNLCAYNVCFISLPSRLLIFILKTNTIRNTIFYENEKISIIIL